MLNTPPQSTCFQKLCSCAESAFPGKDNAFHYKSSLQAVLGPGAGEAGAGHLCPKTSLLSDLITLPVNSKEKSSELPTDGRRRGRSVEGTLSGDEARPPPCVEKPSFLRAELEVVSMFQIPRWAKSPAGCSTRDGLGGFDIPIPSATANGPSPKHCSWKKIPKPLFAGAPSLPSMFHSEHLRKDSSLLQVFDSWVSLLPWAGSGVSAQGAAAMLLHQLLHRHLELSFSEEDKRS